MKSFLILGLWSAAATATGAPTMGYDPNTVKSCVEWYNNGMEETCEEPGTLLLASTASPGTISRNCIVTKERLEDFSKTHTTTTTTTTTTGSATSTTKTLGPSPTAWTSRGCYAESVKFPVLEKPMSGDGDAALTVPKCQDLCYRQSLRFAGVKEGNQCWCSANIAGEHAKDQTDCNLPCTGDKATTCGGKDSLEVFEASKEELPRFSSSTTVSSGSSASASSSSSNASSAAAASQSSSTVSTTRANSGAMRNMRWF